MVDDLQSVDEFPASKHPSIQASKHPSIQASKHPSIQAPKHPSIQASSYSGRRSPECREIPSIQASTLCISASIQASLCSTHAQLHYKLHFYCVGSNSRVSIEQLHTTLWKPVFAEASFWGRYYRTIYLYLPLSLNWRRSPEYRQIPSIQASNHFIFSFFFLSFSGKASIQASI